MLDIAYCAGILSKQPRFLLLTALTIKYFEPGHTFMAADSFHHAVEYKIRSKKFVMDFGDFTAITQEKGNAFCMKTNDFTSYENKMSSAKFTNHPLLEDVTVVRFEKYSTKMFWKSRIDDVEFKSGEFLQKKIIAAIASGKQHSFPSREVNKGMSQKRKDGIIKNLCPLMKENRKIFWQSLKVSNDEGIDEMDEHID